VLLLFNERDSVALADMGRLTGMEDKDLRLTLLSLSMGKPVRAACGGVMIGLAFTTEYRRHFPRACCGVI
jgi:hypothetical protein